jgi:hypothetical protein
MRDNNFYKTIYLDRFQILSTSEGFMVIDYDCDDYLYDENGDNCFSGIQSAKTLLNDAIATVLEHKDEISL